MRAPHAVSAGGTYSFIFENDIFGGTDTDYTNGVRLDHVSRRNALPFWARPLRRNLGWLTDAGNWYATYAISQNIYTPRDTTLETPPGDDRPYAGFLYGSIGIVADRGDRRDTIALDVGVVGPASQADHVQGFVHDVIGAPRPEGWDHQLKNEPAIRLIYERKYRSFRHVGLGVGGLEADVAPHFNFALGNVDTSAGAGLTVRVGDRLGEDYGPACVCPPVAEPGLYRGTDGFGWYLFARAEARLVGRNIFVEGNTFGDGPGVEPERVVGDLQAGIALQYNGVELSYTYVIRSPEHRGQTSFAKFGSLKLRFRY